MGTYIDKVHRYFRFSPTEMRALLITIIVVGVIWGWNDGAKEFVFANYMKHMVISIAIAGVAILVKESTHKLMGLSAGYRVEYQMWLYGLILALAVCIVSRGYIPLIITGGFMLHHMAMHRLGFFRYGTNTLDLGMIALMGPIANIIFATIIMNIHLYIIPLGPIAPEFFKFSLVFAVMNLLPIPPLAGSKFFFRTRLGFFFIFGFILVYTIFIYFFDIYSWFLGLLGALIVWGSFYLLFEKDAMDWP